jgi:hypothetical protein
MTGQKLDIDNIRIASPCPVGWEAMKGDDRKRHCDLCSLNVYNISEMTRAEAEGLFAKSGDRVCVRIYRRADGTVLTKDCPVGLRKYRKRVATFAGAALSMVLGLFSVGYGQCKVKTGKNVVPASKLDIGKEPNKTGDGRLKGIIVNPNGAVIPNVEVLLFSKDTDKPLTATSDGTGAYSFESLKPGVYTMAIKAKMGFKSLAVKDINIEQGFTSELIVSLQPGEGTLTVGGAEMPLIDVRRMGGTTVITSEMIDRMP